MVINIVILPRKFYFKEQLGAAKVRAANEKKSVVFVINFLMLLKVFYFMGKPGTVKLRASKKNIKFIFKVISFLC